MNDVTLTIIEIVIGIVVEGVILSMIFAYIANLSSEKQNQNFKDLISEVENQSKFQFEQMAIAINQAKSEIISQIKESEKKGGDTT